MSEGERRSFAKDNKRRAVELVVSSDRSIESAAKELSARLGAAAQ